MPTGVASHGPELKLGAYGRDGACPEEKLGADVLTPSAIGDREQPALRQAVGKRRLRECEVLAVGLRGRSAEVTGVFF